MSRDRHLPFEGESERLPAPPPTLFPPTLQELQQFLDLVARMRVNQRLYFTQRQQAYLVESKKLEREVDLALDKWRRQDS